MNYPYGWWLCVSPVPNGNQAELGNKIEDYCLNLNHDKGKHKAALFQNKLGITIKNADILKQALKQSAKKM